MNHVDAWNWWSNNSPAGRAVCSWWTWRPPSQDFERRSERLVFRVRFRQCLTRQFADRTLAEISAEPNLEASLSPSYPRAFLRRGRSGWAAIGAPPESDSAGLLTFGLIWLDHLRRREKRARRHEGSRGESSDPAQAAANRLEARFLAQSAGATVQPGLSPLAGRDNRLLMALSLARANRNGAVVVFDLGLATTRVRHQRLAANDPRILVFLRLAAHAIQPIPGLCWLYSSARLFRSGSPLTPFLRSKFSSRLQRFCEGVAECLLQMLDLTLLVLIQ
jgi:hypothetical protein